MGKRYRCSAQLYGEVRLGVSGMIERMSLAKTRKKLEIGRIVIAYFPSNNYDREASIKSLMLKELLTRAVGSRE